MKLTGDYVFNAPIEEVWKALLDPVVLAATMPGCDKLERVGEQYVGDLNVKVGPVQGKFTGKIDLEDVRELEGYTVKVDGRGGPGFVTATAKVTLARAGADTQLAYEADANVGGKIASVGQRLVEASAKAIIKQSLEGLHETVRARAAAAEAARAAAEAAAASAKAAVVAPAAEADASAPASGDVPVPSSSADAPAAVPSSSAPVAAPVVPLPKPVDPSKLAREVAKEVTKSLAPTILRWTIAAVVVVAVLAWWLSRT